MAKLTKNKSYSILIVDDVPDNLRLLSSILSKRGYKVRLAPNGSFALKTVRKEVPDLILLDIRMPGLDGYDVCRNLKKSKRSRDIPIIFLSALNESEDKIRAFKLGSVDYITKPFKEIEVLTRIKHQMELKTYREKLEQMVRERTAELETAIENLKTEITTRKKAERDLERKNIALQEILNHLEAEKEKVKKELATGIETLILPTLKKIEGSCDSIDKKFVTLLAVNIKQVCDPFTKTLNNVHARFSPQEAEICQMIRTGLKTKEISEMLNLSVNTIKWHRNNIRKKIGLTSRKESLTVVLANQIRS